jgi:hypothetical protein
MHILICFSCRGQKKAHIFCFLNFTSHLKEHSAYILCEFILTSYGSSEGTSLRKHSHTHTHTHTHPKAGAVSFSGVQQLPGLPL